MKIQAESQPINTSPAPQGNSNTWEVNWNCCASTLGALLDFITDIFPTDNSASSEEEYIVGGGGE